MNILNISIQLNSKNEYAGVKLTHNGETYAVFTTNDVYKDTQLAIECFSQSGAVFLRSVDSFIGDLEMFDGQPQFSLAKAYILGMLKGLEFADLDE